MAGAVAGYVARMFSTESQIKDDLAFIKGQLHALINSHKDLDDLKVRHAILDKDHEGTKKDLNAAHVKLRDVSSNIRSNQG